MKTHILTAGALVLALHAAAPLVAPPAVGAADLALHQGEKVQLTGFVADVEAGARISRVWIEDPSGRSLVLVERAPPVGALVRVVGEPAADGAGIVVWARTIEVLEEPRRDVTPLQVALARAAQFAGQPIAIAGAWDADASALVGEAGALPVRVRGPDPTPGPAVLWGRLVYLAETASYRLEATGWEPWTPSS